MNSLVHFNRSVVLAARLAAEAGMCLPSLKYEVPAHRFIVPPRNSSIYALRILNLRTPQEDFRVSNFMGQCAPLVNFLIKRKSDPLNCFEVILVDVVRAERGRFAPRGSCLFVYLFSPVLFSSFSISSYSLRSSTGILRYSKNLHNVTQCTDPNSQNTYFNVR